MDKTSLYVKKIFIFLLVSMGVFAGFSLLQKPLTFFILPIAFLTIALLHFGFSDRQPPYQFVLDKSDNFINNKNGFWMFLKPLLMLVGFIYDIILWTFWGVFLLYEFVLEVMRLIITVFYWIFYGILWFLMLFVAPLRLLFFWVVYYLVKWPWWLFKLSFVNISNAYKRNYYYVSVWGSVLALGIIFLFYYVGVISGVIGLTTVGIILSILPISWSFGEISNIRKERLEQKPYWEVKKKFDNGMESVRNILIYLLVFLVLALSQVLLNLLGWIPAVGYTLLGTVFTLNNLISFLLIVLSFIVFFAATILPSNLLFGGKAQFEFNEMLSQLGVIAKRFLRVLFVNLPSTLFGGFVLILPAILLFLTVGLTYQVKNKVLDAKINGIKAKQEFVSGMEAKYKLQKDIEKLEVYKQFPLVTFNDIRSLDALKQEINSNQNTIGASLRDLESLNAQYNADKAELGRRIEGTMNIADAEARGQRNTELADQIGQLETDYEKRKMALNQRRFESEVNIEHLANYRTQTYIVFFFVGIWIALFAGLAIAFYVAYMGNVYYDLYHFNEDGKPVYLMQKVYEENEADRKQPLLGFTLLVALVLVLIFWGWIVSMIQSVQI
jgi:hypothetical protein